LSRVAAAEVGGARTSLRRLLALTALILAAACGRSESGASVPAGEWLAFGGSWTATGVRHTLPLGAERRAAVFDLAGSLVLAGEERPAVGFRARAIGFSDGAAGLQGRAVWTDERGDEVHSELRGEGFAGGSRITGTFTGGTGRYAGVSGEYTFRWQYVLESEDGAVSGRAIDLRVRARLDPAAASDPGSAR
jgi:hypothetical protein